MLISGGTWSTGLGRHRVSPMLQSTRTHHRRRDLAAPGTSRGRRPWALGHARVVDVHTHYDGQATWDEVLAPTAWHGVTTLVMGNCGVGFAPVRPDRHDWLIGLMEESRTSRAPHSPRECLGLGDLPRVLDALDRRRFTRMWRRRSPRAVRAYVMGERGAKNEPATREEIAAMKPS